MQQGEPELMEATEAQSAVRTMERKRGLFKLRNSNPQGKYPRSIYEPHFLSLSIIHWIPETTDFPTEIYAIHDLEEYLWAFHGLPCLKTPRMHNLILPGIKKKRDCVSVGHKKWLVTGMRRALRK